MFQFNTITENLDLSDNYVEGEGATHIARMLKENAFITSLVSQVTVVFLNFRTPQNFAVIYLKFKLRGKTLGYSSKKCKWNSKQ